MALATLFTLMDDIATTLDDIAMMTKVAAKKTAGILGDDLAVNAEQVIGFAAQRELPIVMKVATGSLINKAILVPLALAVSAFFPIMITLMLILGGLYLSFEGAEKFLTPHNEHHSSRAPLDENTRIKGAIRTDFILSLEIIVISLGMLNGSLMQKALALSIIAIAMTILVYGMVALIVKLDDIGIWLMRNTRFQRTGQMLVSAMPYLMKALTIIGTIAMFLVGGGLLMHNLFPSLSHGLEEIWGSSIGGTIGLSFSQIVLGFIAGALLVGIVKGVEKWRNVSSQH